jgi:hypothetical protein
MTMMELGNALVGAGVTILFCVMIYLLFHRDEDEYEG